MPRIFCFAFLLCTIFSFVTQDSAAQRGLGSRMRSFGGGGGGGGDSLESRSKYEDSITINFRYLDSSRTLVFDSSISDYATRFPLPPTHVSLGNVGTASHSLLFQPGLKAGWDAGFHAFDAYKFNLEQVRFFNTTRPFTELSYVLGTQSQQFIEVIHTQNIKPNWNAAFRYRLINAPGFFQNQKTNHNNYLLSSWYQSNNKRYNNYLILLNNALQAGENGGIINDSFLVNPDFKERFTIPVNIGNNIGRGRDFFNTTLVTGNRYVEKTALLRQQYDLGKKDSVVTDSTVVPLFYPRLRFEHTLSYGSSKYLFQNITSDAAGDSAYYGDRYGSMLEAIDTMIVQEKWKELKNDFSIYQFPDAKNLQQFFKAGILHQALKGRTSLGAKTLYNIALHGEYRNRTRNKKWDAIAYGSLYLNGYNAGDYEGYISLQRFLGTQWGSLQVGFQNVNRAAPFTYDRSSSFYLDSVKQDFKKENTTHFFGTVTNPKLGLTLGADYFLVSNYLYLKGFRDLRQEGTLFNLLRINASKLTRIGRHWRWYADVWVQQKAGNADVNVPFLYTRNRFAFEGLFFKNLNLSTGIEMRYHTPYKADGYSPVLGRFFYQDSITISNRPQLDAYFNFRIRSLKVYIRAENLNALTTTPSFGFTHNYAGVPGYPYPGLVTRFGFYWNFVN